MSIFSKNEVNNKRQFEFDLAKAICILGMVLVHTIEVMGQILEVSSSESSYNSFYYILIIVLDALFGAGTFMSSMGLGICYSKSSNPDSLIKRGFKIFILGYILNFIRLTLPYLIFHFITGLSFSYALCGFLVNDILQFAGLALMLLGLLKKFNLKDIFIVIIAVILSIIGSIFRFNDFGPYYINEIIGNFLGTIDDVFVDAYAPFPLFNWFIIVVFGYLLGKLIKRCNNLDKFYLFTGIASTIVVLTYMIICIPNKLGMMSGDILYYYHLTIFDTVIVMFGTLFAISLYHFISKLFNDKVKKFITILSSNINKVYCIHLIILNLTYTVLLYLGVTINLLTLILFGIFLYIISNIIAILINNRKPKFKVKKYYNKLFKLSFSELLKRRVKYNPDKVIYKFNNESYTWTDIDKASDIIACDLIKQGVKKGTHVGICSVNSINWIYTFFAVQKLGAISVLINPLLKIEEIKKLCFLSDVTHLCFSDTPRINIDDIKTNFTNIDYIYNISNIINFKDRFNELENINNNYDIVEFDDPSIMIFSSGTTGIPKVIIHSTYSMVRPFYNYLKDYQLSNEDINLAFLPFFHIFGFLTGVASSLVVNELSIICLSNKPEYIINNIYENKCSIFYSVPTMMIKIMELLNYEGTKLNSLRLCVLAGSSTEKHQMELFTKALPNTHFSNVYGMSENTFISYSKYNDNVTHICETIGKPAKNMLIEIKDQNGNSLPKNNTGEICVKSEALLVCYYKINLENQPFDDKGFLKTGDLGYIDNDGYLRLVGRIKDLIIVNGENISPTEIQEVISELDFIEDVKVIGIKDDIKGEIPVAAITIKNGYTFNEEKVREYVSNKLSSIKNPVYYFQLESFPLLANGKIDSINLKEIINNKIKDLK